MNLDALLEPIPSRRKITLCKLGQTLSKLEEPYKTALQKLVATSYADGGLSDRDLSVRLDAAGIQISTSVIHYHRRSLCSCRGAAE